jgi:hypothetical protein
MEDTPKLHLNGNEEEEQIALRWRCVILRLSENLLDAAAQRSELSPILLGALHNALDQLLLYGEEGDLMALEEWLVVEDCPPPAPRRRERRLVTHAWPGQERRTAQERRATRDRRVQADRRGNA